MGNPAKETGASSKAKVNLTVLKSCISMHVAVENKTMSTAIQLFKLILLFKVRQAY